MIKIAALNASSSEDEGTNFSVHKSTTKEAQEAEAFSLYNKALGYQRQGDHDSAEDVFHNLLDMPFVKQANEVDKEDGIMRPCQLLKYSICKNLATVSCQRQDYHTAMEHYLEAVLVDSTDVSVWFQIGKIALKLINYPLARHAFEQGLQCSPKHWPCLDKVITVLYVLGNYYACLCYIAVALERDSGYVKGLVFMNQIFKEQPSLRKQTLENFKNCDPEIHKTELEQEEIDEFYGEAVEMRDTRREMFAPLPQPSVPLKMPAKKELSWYSLGQNLVATYDYIAKKVSQMSLSYRVDLSAYMNELEVESQDSQGEDQPEPVIGDPVASTLQEALEAATVAMETEAEEGKAMEEASGKEEDEPPIDWENLESRSNTPVNAMQGEEGASGKKRQRKRSLLEDLGAKRRSARVRNIPKAKQEESVNYQEVLLRILPVTLLHVQEVEENGSLSQDGGEQDRALQDQAGQQEQQPRRPSEGSTCPNSEQQHVTDFLTRLGNNSGIISLLNEYLICVANHANAKWHERMSSLFLQAYGRLRKHIEFPGYLCKDTTDERIKDMAILCLVQAEHYVDTWLSLKPKTSPRKSAGVQAPAMDKLTPHFLEDLSYIEGITFCQSILQPDWMNYCLRATWMHAQYYMLEGDLDLAAGYFDKTIMYLTLGEQEQGSPVTVKLPNCQTDKTICKEEVVKQLESLRRFQSFEDMQRLYEQGDYEQVVTFLVETFTHVGTKDRLMKMAQQERYAQLLLLQDSLHKLQDYKRGLIWGEVSLNEALQVYLNTSARPEKDEWCSTIIQLLQAMDKCVREKARHVEALTSSSLVRLTQNLIKMIDLSLDVADNAPNLALPTMLPWVLLYRLVLHEEKRGVEAAEEDEGALPSSLMLLQLAHDYLGGRGLCVCCDGSLLLFIVDVLLAELSDKAPDTPHPYKTDIDQMIEQCFYCMYGYPNKRRAKNLQDHTSNQLVLIWERAELIFDYFKPESMPEFDSLKVNTVSGELEGLLRRILGIIPLHHKTVLTTRIEKLTNYIEGFSNEPPTFPELQDQKIVSELFYLLGDYYFKNKEQGKAIKYLQQDLCFNPERFDAWAGLALSRASKLEQKLNAVEDIEASDEQLSDNDDGHELKWDGKAEGATWKQAIVALRCFKRALDLDCSNSKLWIEYGSLAYQLHSYASRQLKLQSWYALSEESLETAKSNRTEMLKIAGNCYRKASECDGEDNEEQWLSHYMLGKIAEKLARPPADYLQHYKQAAHFLHEDQAKYPKKITYVLSPPHLAVESVEVYYRLHVSTIKYVMSNIKQATLIPLDTFLSYINEAAEGPFAQAREKKMQDTDEMANLLVLTPTKKKQSSQDHNYFRQQSGESGGRWDENSQEVSGKREVMNQRTLVPVLMSDSAESQSPGRSLAGSPAHSQGPAVATHSHTTSLTSIQYLSPTVVNSSTTVQSSSPMTLISSSVPSSTTVQSPVTTATTQKVSSVFSMASILGNSPPSITTSSQPMEGQSTGHVTFSSQSSIESLTSITSKSKPKIELELTSSKNELVHSTTENTEKDTAQADVIVIDSDPEPSLSQTGNVGSEKSTSGTATETEAKRNESKMEVGESKMEVGESKMEVDDVKVESTDETESLRKEEIRNDLQANEQEKTDTQESEGYCDTTWERRQSALDDEESKKVIEEAAASLMFLAGSIKAEQELLPYQDLPDPFADLDPDPPKLEPEPLSLRAMSPGSSQDSAEEALERLKSEILFLNESGPPSLPDVVAWKSEESGRESEDDRFDMKRSANIEIHRDSLFSTKEIKQEVLDLQVLPSSSNENEKSASYEKATEPAPNRMETEDLKVEVKNSESFTADAKACEPMEVSSQAAEAKDEDEVILDHETGELVSPSAKELSVNTDTDNNKATTNIPSSKIPTVQIEKEAGTVEKQGIEDMGKACSSKDTTQNVLEVTAVMDSDKAKEKVHEPIDAKDDEEERVRKSIRENKMLVDTTEVKIQKLLQGCMKAFSLCLNRFPHHYKSYYRMAYAYYHCSSIKNLEYCRDLLLGNALWHITSYMPGPGMFFERKPTNFFQGLWKIPSEDIDRAGSFASHLRRCLVLLLEVLRDLDDALTLFQIHLQLIRTPDQGKKYLRDSDRSVLASRSYQFSLDALEQKMMLRARNPDLDTRISYIMECYKIWQYGVKLSHSVDRINAILLNAYAECFKEQVMAGVSLMDQALSFCQQQQQLQAPSTPTETTKSLMSGAAIIDRTRLSTEKRTVKVQRSLSREDLPSTSQGKGLQSSPVKTGLKDSSAIKAAMISGVKNLSKSGALQDKLASIVGQSLSASKSSIKAGKHPSSSSQGGLPAKMPKLIPETKQGLSVKPGRDDAAMPQLSPQMAQGMMASQMSAVEAMQLSYYYAQLTGMDPNAVWMSMMMGQLGQYTQDEMVARAVASAMAQGLVSPPSSLAKAPHTSSHKSPKPHKAQTKSTETSAVKYIQTHKGLVQEVTQSHSSQPKPAHSQPKPAHAQPRPAHSAIADSQPAYSQPKPAHSQPKPAHTLPKPAHSQPKPAHTQPKPAHSQIGSVSQPPPAHSQHGAYLATALAMAPTHGQSLLGHTQLKVTQTASKSKQGDVKAASSIKPNKPKKKLGQQHESILRNIMTSPLYLTLQAQAQAKKAMQQAKQAKAATVTQPKMPAMQPIAQTFKSPGSGSSYGSVSTPGSLNTPGSFSTPGSVGSVSTPAVRPISATTVRPVGASATLPAPPKLKLSQSSDSDVIILSESDSD